MTHAPGPPPPSADDFMDGAGVKSASFNGTPPITWAGEIVDDPRIVQKRDFDTGEPLFWSDGRPKNMLQVDIQTNARDDADDDGKRALYLEFRKRDAVAEAIKRAGCKGAPQRGGWLSLTYTSDDLAARKGKGNPPKNFVAEYRPPDLMAQADGAPQQGGWGALPPQQQAAAAPPPPVQQQLPAQAQAAPASGPDPQAVAFLAQKGVDPTTMGADQILMVAKTLGYTG